MGSHQFRDSKQKISSTDSVFKKKAKGIEMETDKENSG